MSGWSGGGDGGKGGKQEEKEEGNGWETGWRVRLEEEFRTFQDNGDEEEFV